MVERKLWLRASGRAVVGLVVSVVAVGSVFVVGNLDLSGVSTDALAITVDTEQDAQRTFVCAGPFNELGADPTRPTVSLPVGAAQAAIAGEAEAPRELITEPGIGVPVVYDAAAETSLSVAQLQRLDTETLAGLSASACGEPGNEQWLVGGDTRLGTASTLTVGNPGGVAATVRISLFDENGPVDSVQTAGVLVPAGAQRTVSLNGYAPDRAQLAVRVLSTGAAVTATLGVAQTRDITPEGIDTVVSQVAPARTLGFLGIRMESDHTHEATDVAHIDEYPVKVRLLAPGSTGGMAEVRAFDADGSSTVLGRVTLEPGVVSELVVEKWEESFGAVVVTADVPVVGGAQGSNIEAGSYDFAWFAPSSELPVNEAVAVAVVAHSGASLTLVNTGSAEAEVSVSVQPDEGLIGLAKPTLVRVAAGATAEVPIAPGRALLLTSDAPVRGGVTLSESAGLAAYPVEPPRERTSTIDVYTR